MSVRVLTQLFGGFFREIPRRKRGSRKQGAYHREGKLV